MSVQPPEPGPELEELFALFPQLGEHSRVEFVPGNEVPEPYRKLLVHEHHMTVTVEHHHGGPVDVRVLDSKQTEDAYSRQILLVHKASGKVVQFGIVRIHLQFCSPEVREEILAGKTPLGRILIEHNVLRRIVPTAFLRVFPDPALTAWFGLERSTPTYGRLAIIYCDEQPAIELLEIVAPEGS